MRCLMATGGASHSDAALLFGAYIAQRVGSVPTVLTVVGHSDQRAKGEVILARARQLLAPLVPEIHTRLRVGRPAEEIVAEAREGDYDLVVVGEREKHRLRARLLGPVAWHVVTHASCPVVVAKGKIGSVQRILLCDSGGNSVPLFTRFARQLARMLRGDEEVTVLHVMSQIGAWPGVRGQQLRATAEELIREHAPEGVMLERDVQILSQLGIHPQPKVRHGLVVDEILAETASGDYDLVVIGAHRVQGWQRLLLDDITHQLISLLDRPVLVVR